MASAEGQAAFNERSALLDFAHADVTAVLGTCSGSSRERAKLESYLTALDAFGNEAASTIEPGPLSELFA